MSSLLQNRYKIEQVLGQGGMGRVYKAIDTKENISVAIKQILSSSEKLIERFKRERLFLSTINHPNIPKAYDIFIEQDSYFLVLEFVNGLSFEEFICSHSRTLPLQEKLAIAIQMTRAIEVINLAGIIHRDIKPENIIFDMQNNLVKILDLGIAKSLELDKITSTGAQIGTPAYMSPEQLNEEVFDNTDVFALGILFYQFFLDMQFSPFKGQRWNCV